MRVKGRQVRVDVRMYRVARMVDALEAARSGWEVCRPSRSCCGAFVIQVREESDLFAAVIFQPIAWYSVERCLALLSWNCL